MRCAGTQGLLLPLMQNASCMAKANKLLDVAGQDVSRDGRASAVYNFSALCYDAMAANITGLIVSELGWQCERAAGTCWGPGRRVTTHN